jgi:general secretion pathway protein D
LGRAVKDMGNYDVNTDGTIDFDDTITQSGFAQGGLFDISAVLTNTELYGLLNALAENSDSKAISEPTILTENNRPATIHVGRNLPVVTTQVTETGTTQAVTYIPEGVDLSVTPVVSPGGDQISLTVAISVSEFIAFQNNNPITADRSASTLVTVGSGKTIVIGGLIKESDIETDSGIPLLKDIPLLGYLFKNKTTTKERTELLVFLTPEILID